MKVPVRNMIMGMATILFILATGCATPNVTMVRNVPTHLESEDGVAVVGDEEKANCVVDGLKKYDRELQAIPLGVLDWHNDPEIYEYVNKNSIKYVVNPDINTEVVWGEPNIDDDIEHFSWEGYLQWLRIFAWPFVTTPYVRKTHATARLWVFNKNSSTFTYAGKVDVNVEDEGSITQWLYPAVPVWWNPAITESRSCLGLGKGIVTFLKGEDF